MRPAAQRAPPRSSQDRRHAHHQDQQRAEPRHHMEGVVQQLDVVGPVVLRELVQALHVAVERAVGEEAQHARHDNRIVEPLQLHIGLADDHDAGPGPALETALHRGQRHGLMLRDQLGLHDRPSEPRRARSTTRPAIDADPQEARRLIDVHASAAHSRRPRPPPRTTR